jgi:hypothetical protein
MADQETLTERTSFNPLDHGLWARYHDHGEILHGAWMRACAEGSFVGTCRHCGDYLIPLRPHQVNGKRTDYEAHCHASTCGAIMLAPCGRVLAYSSRASERRKDQ